jgi:glycosyltransferase involved in cell wall biosynthesis
MRIGLNLLYLIPGCSGGTETYARALLRALAAVDGENEYFAFFNREASDVPIPSAGNFHRVDCAVPAVSRALRYAWEQGVLPLQLQRLRIDVVHSLGYVMPLLSPCASVVTVPDLNFRVIASYLPLRKRAVVAVPRWISAQSARFAQRVITISQFSKQEIVTRLGIEPEKVAVTHLGPRFAPEESAVVPLSLTRQRYGLPQRYIVAIGGTSRHKNVVRLLAAFRTLADAYPHALVIPGHIPSDVDVRAEMARPGMAGRLLCLGYVPDEDLASILNGAELFVLPSLYEGFGLPVLEAQQSDVAVACSTAASLPEVAGEGAVYFDPESVESMAGAIRRCLDDPRLRDDLRARGRENLHRFSWEATAKLTLGVYREAIVDRLARGGVRAGVTGR